MLINEEYWNPQVAVDGGERDSNVNQKKKLDNLQACRCPIGDNRYRRVYFFNKYLEYCDLSGKYDFSCASVYNLKDRQVFSDQMNRNCFDLILARHY